APLGDRWRLARAEIAHMRVSAANNSAWFGYLTQGRQSRRHPRASDSLDLDPLRDALFARADQQSSALIIAATPSTARGAVTHGAVINLGLGNVTISVIARHSRAIARRGRKLHIDWRDSSVSS